MLNIHGGRGSRLAQAVQAIELGGFNLMVLTKMKTSMSLYFRNRLGYGIIYSTAQPASAGGAQGGVGLVSWGQVTVYSLELTRFQGPNVISCEVVTGTSQTPIV